jgi:S-adenosylmethionine-diacylglycerol 3-amino-3-carboxypropyl transferase
MRVLTPPVTAARAASHVKRLSLPSAVDDRLYFAQVREDPRLEVEALAPGPDDSIVIVGSGGCTALSLLTAGVGHVTAVDVNRAQNHLIELKVAALTVLSRAESLAFLGAIRSAPPERLRAYEELRAHLTPAALAYWDAHRSSIAAGVLNAGVTERFIRMVVRMLRLAVHPRARIERMLASDTLNAQRFHLLLNRAVFRRAYDPAFFAHLERPSFADHFRWQAEHALTELSVRDNYFLHHMLTGQYPVDTAGGVPPYLSKEACVSVSTSRERLTLVDGTITDHLRGLPDGSVTGFAISNICEWIAPHDVDLLFAEIIRTAAPNATLCFRNFVGWTEVPPRFQHVITEDRVRGETMMRCDRSVVQRRFAFCRVRAETHQ